MSLLARSVSRVARQQRGIATRRVVRDSLCVGVPDRREEQHNVSPLALQSREFHLTRRQENLSPIVIGGSIAAIAYGGKVVIEAYDRRVAAKAAAEAAKAAGEKPEEEAGTSWTSWLNFNLGKRFYEGGFEEEMTRREAALILGIRESAPRDKVRDAHRRLALLNHPDTGGSTFVSSKINEAKDILLGSR
mmetsp:Transcript_12314/g.21980  ORF Transcript_12314/g.21980 Transcript_12314/m.21980 type:complete len:190 (+) Transcript_12314:254-823(+)|eukprot:CAMPEP_0184524674 /NCGR_PEP_ID=MMETSP0198_2-20121128/9657_1 /TAXON_ID=1112570 /ORGANISM="Thraustochytrium sp., Strain LLF1b" /LENGTH=189 /DNA_ID=CAMNT_0026916015 /DNA_START=252 /DNA_END=821 /DNA_ORIENTATION=+